MEIARLAVDLLIERINEKGERRPPRTIRPDFRVVRRESTGFPDETDAVS
jgi:DNA-binding LacI/PurR family transcriptional regulator